MQGNKHLQSTVITMLFGITTFLTLTIGLHYTDQTKDPDVSGSYVFLIFLGLTLITLFLALRTFANWAAEREVKRIEVY